MYISVSFVDLSNTIYVKHSLWNRETELHTVLNGMSENWSIGKVYIKDSPITHHDLHKSLDVFADGYEIQIEQRK